MLIIPPVLFAAREGATHVHSLNPMPGSAPVLFAARAAVLAVLSRAPRTLLLRAEHPRRAPDGVPAVPSRAKRSLLLNAEHP